MAAQLIMPTLPIDQQQSQHFMPNHTHTYATAPVQTHSNLQSHRHHIRSQSYQVAPGSQISPLNTSSTLQTQVFSTPPSPNAQYIPYGQYGRHGQHGGRPLYMPAVLRRCDEFPSHEVVRCRTASSSSSSDTDSTLKRANSILMSIPGLSVLGQHFSQRPACKSPRTLEGNWKLDAFPQVDGVPTRKHWKPDSESTVCDDPVCRRTFNTFVRRHHCRKCGHIFCDWHSSALIPLDHNAEFNPRADPSRTCNYCFNEVKARHSRSRSNSQSSISTTDEDVPTTPLDAPPMPGVTAPHKSEGPVSVQREWDWSTF
ncbi:hypothetical protein E4U38_005478 [Claviceps purpurea]|nr:hypothetical protein E4U38_005478 [Claviceps purpurea]